MPLNVERCECGSVLFLDWGLEVIAARDYRTPAGTGTHGRDYGQAWPVKVCAACYRAWGLWDGHLHDLSEVISQEEIHAALAKLERAPRAAKAGVRDP